MVICKLLKFKNQESLVSGESLLQSLGESLLTVSLGETRINGREGNGFANY